MSYDDVVYRYIRILYPSLEALLHGQPRKEKRGSGRITKFLNILCSNQECCEIFIRRTGGRIVIRIRLRDNNPPGSRGIREGITFKTRCFFSNHHPTWFIPIRQ